MLHKLAASREYGTVPYCDVRRITVVGSLPLAFVFGLGIRDRRHFSPWRIRVACLQKAKTVSPADDGQDVWQREEFLVFQTLVGFLHP